MKFIISILLLTLSLSFCQRAGNPFELLNIPSMKFSDLFSNESIKSSISSDKNNSVNPPKKESSDDIQFIEINNSEVKKIKEKNLKSNLGNGINTERVIPHEKYESIVGYSNGNMNLNSNINTNSNLFQNADTKLNFYDKSAGNQSQEGNKDLFKILDQIQKKISNIEERLSNQHK